MEVFDDPSDVYPRTQHENLRKVNPCIIDFAWDDALCFQFLECPHKRELVLRIRIPVTPRDPPAQNVLVDSEEWAIFSPIVLLWMLLHGNHTHMVVVNFR